MTKDLPLIHELTHNDIRLAKMLKALGNPVRFRIMEYLAEKQMCITGDIVIFASLAQSTVSQHLKVLRERGMVVPLNNGLVAQALQDAQRLQQEYQ